MDFLNIFDYFNWFSDYYHIYLSWDIPTLIIAYFTYLVCHILFANICLEFLQSISRIRLAYDFSFLSGLCQIFWFQSYASLMKKTEKNLLMIELFIS